MSFKQNIMPIVQRIFKKTTHFYSRHWFLYNVFLSVVTVFITEIFSRASVFDAVAYLVLYFPSALMSILIVLTMLMIPMMFKKSIYWKYFICAFWITLSIVNFIMFSFRMMPFNFTDILLIPSTFTVLPVYLSVWQMILIVVAVILLLCALVYIYKKTPMVKARVKTSLLFFCLMLMISFSYYLFASSVNVIDNRISGLINKYNNNGFVYCFTSSTVDTGMREPADYSAAEVANLVKDINKSGEDKPINANIIFLQLESFFDVSSIENISYSQNPMPVFTDLLKNNSNGYLNVPTFSAGTANTEFEVLTAMNIDFFGIGEFPYQTLVEDTVVESIPFLLKESGYKTHAIHNNSATFYNRNKIYSNLGFDTFTSLEYMYDVQYNELGWAKDICLASSITDCLDSTSEPDLIYTVGVQTHGSYPSNIDNLANTIEVTGIEEESDKKSYEYYINQLREVDAFIGVLLSELKLRDEPTVLVIFGDHKPGFEFEKWNSMDTNIYQTEYVLWSNFDMDLVIKDLESYQLYPYVLERLNMTGGIMSKLHQKYSYRLNEEYLANFELLQYDMIYGDGVSYGTKTYKPSKLKLGIKNITFDEVNTVAGNAYIHGNNFNEYSHVFVNDKKVNSKFINSEQLALLEQNIKKGDKIKICQLDKNGNILSETNSIKY